MSDILERLHQWTSYEPGTPLDVDGARDRAVALRADLTEAIAEIKHLRSLAGAVSRGEDMADIKAKLHGQTS